MDDSIEEAVVVADPTNQKKYKYGVIYLSYIPDGLNVKLLREIMGEYGEVGRIYLQPERNNKKHRSYLEGWIEFKKKRVAKSVAETLNGTALQHGRKHCKMNGQIWSLKYLHKFKWAHLMEQIAHDKAVRDQKRKFEYSQAKKQADFYQQMTERSRRMKKSKSESENPDDNPSEALKQNAAKSFYVKQKVPKKQGEEFAIDVDDELLGSIFKKVS